jgi:DNA-binding NarL/FixJ family response regulator
LLLAGYTDAAVARQLELSERTVQRRISALMLALGVGTRIQLGWQIRDHGWL